MEDFHPNFAHSNEYYYRIFHHSGSTKLHSAISKHFYFRSMRDTINRFVKSCDICQRVKGPFPHLGHLSVKQTEVNPWDEVQIDLVGPWTFQIPPKWSVSVLVLTSIDPFSGLCDACRLENKTSSHVANKLILFGWPVTIAPFVAFTTTIPNSLYYNTWEFQT